MTNKIRLTLSKDPAKQKVVFNGHSICEAVTSFKLEQRAGCHPILKLELAVKEGYITVTNEDGEDIGAQIVAVLL